MTVDQAFYLLLPSTVYRLPYTEQGIPVNVEHGMCNPARSELLWDAAPGVAGGMEPQLMTNSAMTGLWSLSANPRSRTVTLRTPTLSDTRKPSMTATKFSPGR